MWHLKPPIEQEQVVQPTDSVYEVVPSYYKRDADTVIVPFANDEGKMEIGIE